MQTEATWNQFVYLSDLVNNHSCQYLQASREILINKEGLPPGLPYELKQLDIEYEPTGEGLRIQDLQNVLPFFYDLNTYVKDFTLSWLDRDFGILNFAQGIFYDCSEKQFISANKKPIATNEASNNIYYLKIKALLSDNTLPAGSFANYPDTAHNKIVVLSGVKGTIVIGYPIINPIFNSKIDLKAFYNKLEKSLDAKGYVDLFKSEVFDFIKDVAEIERLPYIASNLALLIENSDRNFAIYMSNFSFDKLRDGLKQGKIKYFDLTRDILSKIYGQITAVPIAISASAFATYKVDDLFTLVLIFCGFAIYAFFVFQLIFVLKTEINSVSTDFENDKDEIIKKSCLDKATITKEISTIEQRIKKTKNLITIFLCMFTFLTLLFLTFITYQILTKTFNINIFLIISLSLADIIKFFYP